MHFMQTGTAAYPHPQQDTFHKPASWQVDKASCEPAGPSQCEHMLILEKMSHVILVAKHNAMHNMMTLCLAWADQTAFCICGVTMTATHSGPVTRWLMSTGLLNWP